MKITYSAPSKVIFSGEHSVVYGKPALVCALDLRLKFSVWESDINQEDKIISNIHDKIISFLKEQNIFVDKKNINFSINSEIPIGRGLGSSAALSCAASGAFLELYTKKTASNDYVNICAYCLEKIFHTNPSGVDNSTSCFGGFIYFRKEFEFLKTISPLKIKLPENFINNIFLIDTGEPFETTSEMVGLVNEKFKKSPKNISEKFNQLEKITKEIVFSLQKNDEDLFSKLISENQKILDDFSIVSKKSKLIIDQISQFGSVKITGAGGNKTNSGFLLVYSKNKNKLDSFCKENNLKILNFVPCYTGLKKEN